MSQTDLMVLGEQFIAALRGQPSSCYNLYSQEEESDAHHVSATDGLESIPPLKTCSLAHVGVEDSQPAGSSRCFHLRIWMRDRNGRTCRSFDSGLPGPPLLTYVFS